MNDGKQLKCPHCGHEWVYHGRMRMATCPSCTRKVDTSKVPEQLLEHFNLDEHGVRILDRSLATKNSPKGRIIDVYFKQGKVLCDYDKSGDCNHVKYALSLDIVHEIFKKKGWKIR